MELQRNFGLPIADWIPIQQSEIRNVFTFPAIAGSSPAIP
jgi:hypothetical protein